MKKYTEIENDINKMIIADDITFYMGDEINHHELKYKKDELLFISSVYVEALKEYNILNENVRLNHRAVYTNIVELYYIRKNSLEHIYRNYDCDFIYLLYHYNMKDITQYIITKTELRLRELKLNRILKNNTLESVLI